MGSNVKLSADERTCRDENEVAILVGNLADPHSNVDFAWERIAEYRRAIRAMRERVAVVHVSEFDRDNAPKPLPIPAGMLVESTEPPLTPERAREVMHDYPEWVNEYQGNTFRRGKAEVSIGPYAVAASADWMSKPFHTITTESALRSFCEGRKA